MPFQKFDNNLDELKKIFKKELSGALHMDKQGIIIKADSLGSLDALINLLKLENIHIVKAGIGPIGKGDISSAKANLEIFPLDAIILGFNVSLEEGVEAGNVKILRDDVIYKLIENLQEWRKAKQADIEKERLMELASICKLEVLHNFVFRNSNPAIFGVRVLGGSVKIGLPLIDEKGEKVARVKGLQKEKEDVKSAKEGDELAIALPGLNFERRFRDVKFMYSDIGAADFKNFKKNKDLLSNSELRVLDEISRIKGF